jgi:hypothetical protein
VKRNFSSETAPKCAYTGMPNINAFPMIYPNLRFTKGEKLKGGDGVEGRGEDEGREGGDRSNCSG